jgi:signal peptidase I
VTLVLPPLGIAAMAIGVLLIARQQVVLGVVLVVLGLLLPIPGVLIVEAVFLKPYRIPSESMKPTLEAGDRVLVNRRAGPDRGDIVAFKPPAGVEIDQCGVQGQPQDGHPCSRPLGGEAPDLTFVSRIVAEPGDLLSVVRNRVYVDGKLQDEPFAATGGPCAELCNLPKEIRIPPGHYFTMGDNRGVSSDSRAWGPVPEDSIVGQVSLRYWPLRRLGNP